MSDKTVDFQIKPNLGQGLRLFFYSQLFVTPKYPAASFAGQTVIVTGSNVGLGLESARHFYRLGCAKLILAVRSVGKGKAAKEDIISSVKTRKDPEAIEIWTLDVSSTASVQAFAEQVKSNLDRLDVVVENAGVNSPTRYETEGYEQTMQINVLNTTLLALLLLPKFAETKAKFPDAPLHLTIVSSDAHRLNKFPAVNAPNIFDKLNEKETYVGQDRYEVSKLLEILIFREIVARQKGPSPVIINLVSPGLCKSTLDSRDSSMSFGLRVFHFLLDRTTEQGSRTYVLAASSASDAHGGYMSDGKLQPVESWIRTEMGKKVQEKTFNQTMQILEARNPGLARSAGI